MRRTEVTYRICPVHNLPTPATYTHGTDKCPTCWPPNSYTSLADLDRAVAWAAQARAEIRRIEKTDAGMQAWE
jgi:hypothetical protein